MEEDAGADLDLRRAERSGLDRQVRRALHDYPLRMGRDSTWAGTLPRLTPLPGHTPERPPVRRWSFRVYAVLQTGNVRGSRTVRVPEAAGGMTKPELGNPNEGGGGGSRLARLLLDDGG